MKTSSLNCDSNSLVGIHCALFSSSKSVPASDSTCKTQN